MVMPKSPAARVRRSVFIVGLIVPVVGSQFLQRMESGMHSWRAMTESIKNGLILPRDPKNLELLLRDVEAKGYLDIELVYRLRQKESLGSVKQKIVRKIQQNESAFCFEDLVRETLEAV
jgi:hypothetical protein